MRVRYEILAIGLCTSLLGACTYTAPTLGPSLGASLGPGPTPGSLTITRPGAIPPLAQAAPQPTAPPRPRNGRYVGEARRITNPGARNACRETIPITNFVVNGTNVRFGAFRGTIGPDGRLDMQAGHRFVSGQFSGERFEGRLWEPPPSCAYWIALDPAG